MEVRVGKKKETRERRDRKGKREGSKMRNRTVVLNFANYCI